MTDMELKPFMDINRAKFAEDGWSSSNVGGFEPGDQIQISEKLDGSNASMRYDVETDTLVAFSRKHKLSFNLTLNGFWNYVQTLNPEDYKDTPNYYVFGEWGVKNAIRYRDDVYGRWYVYDIFDIERQRYLPQSEVKAFVEKHGLTYIHVLYEGEFVSWEHCKTFCNSPAYGERQEGIVVKNQSKLNDTTTRLPFVLKIVNDSFSEVQRENRKMKAADPSKIEAKAKASEIADMIVTKRRVEKELRKMQDEGILPVDITSQDMGVIAKNLPKRIYDDCMKEEYELVVAGGEYFGKASNTKAMRLAKEILLA